MDDIHFCFAQIDFFQIFLPSFTINKMWSEKVKQLLHSFKVTISWIFAKHFYRKKNDWKHFQDRYKNLKSDKRKKKKKKKPGPWYTVCL